MPTSLKEMSDRLDALKAEMKAHGEQALKDACAAFFEQAPEVLSITWLQYTPYHNDGDACTFSVHEVYPASVEEPSTYPDGDEEGFDLWMYPKDEKGNTSYHNKVANYPWVESFEELSSLIEGNEELMQQAFGDHVQVTVTRSGVTVSEYSHD